MSYAVGPTEPYKSRLRIYSWDTFFKLDFEKQKYIFIQGQVYKENVGTKSVDNDDIFALYLNKSTLVFLNTHFFVKRTSVAYIVYDKTTKKVRSNAKKNYEISRQFLNYFFNNSIIINQVVIPQMMSNTFMKRVIEGKISNIEDVLKYFRSYVYRKKDIPDIVLLNFNCITSVTKNLAPYVPFIKNWEVFKDLKNCQKLISINLESLKCLNYEINTEEDLNHFKIVKEYDHWKNKISNEING
jgi:hypothetical protein